MDRWMDVDVDAWLGCWLGCWVLGVSFFFLFATCLWLDIA